MLRKTVRIVFLAAVLACVFTAVQAADVVSFDLRLYSPGWIQMEWLLTNPVVDNPVGGGYDKTWMALVDCQGAILGFHVDAYFLEDGEFHGSSVEIPLTSLNPITGRKIIAKLYDTPDEVVYYSHEELYQILQTYPLLATGTLDMGESYPECPPVEDNPDNPGDIPSFDDGRLNTDPGAPIVMYNHDGSFQVYKIGPNSQGTIALSISLETLAGLETPPENTEIARSEDGSVVLYKLTSGELQVNTAPDAEGKVFVYIFESDPLRLIQTYTYQAE